VPWLRNISSYRKFFVKHYHNVKVCGVTWFLLFICLHIAQCSCYLSATLDSVSVQRWLCINVFGSVCKKAAAMVVAAAAIKLLITLHFALRRGAKHCDEYVCLSTHITQKPRGWTSPDCCAYCLWPWLSPPLVASYTSGFVDDVMSSHNEWSILVQRSQRQQTLRNSRWVVLVLNLISVHVPCEF